MANYDINYNDQRFQQVEADKNVAINNLEQTYNGMINATDAYYNSQIQASKDWANKQTQLQNEKTEFAIEQIEQQKEQANKDYIREQQGSYVDWQKQSDNYGAIAEQQAASGLRNSGYSESSKVSMYNTYQNRVATARDSYNRAVLNYNNAITEARLQNNSILAEIAFEALQKQLELSLQAFQYKNQLIMAKTEQRMALDDMYYGRYQDVLAQINTEIALAEQVRQYNASLAEDQRQFNANLAFEREQFEYQKKQDAAKAKASSGGSSSGSKSSGSKSSGSSSSGSSSNKKSSSGSSSKSSNPPIDMQSVLDLGYGPISASKLNQLEKQGLVTSYVSGGKTKFKKSAYAFKQESLLSPFK